MASRSEKREVNGGLEDGWVDGWMGKWMDGNPTGTKRRSLCIGGVGSNSSELSGEISCRVTISRALLGGSKHVGVWTSKASSNPSLALERGIVSVCRQTDGSFQR